MRWEGKAEPHSISGEGRTSNSRASRVRKYPQPVVGITNDIQFSPVQYKEGAKDKTLGEKNAKTSRPSPQLPS